MNILSIKALCLLLTSFGLFPVCTDMTLDKDFMLCPRCRRATPPGPRHRPHPEGVNPSTPQEIREGI